MVGMMDGWSRIDMNHHFHLLFFQIDSVLQT